MKKSIQAIIMALVLATVAFAAPKTSLVGAGATFPYPLYSKMFSVYNQLNGVEVNYQAIGSGGGVKQLTAKTVDFGASDKFLSDKKMAKIGAPVLHMPTALGAVVVTYNLPGAPELNLNGEVVAEIFMGKIKKWNDAKIAALNPGVKLPKKRIVVVRRSDGSGTTFIFSDFLSKVSSAWKEKVGAGKSLKWPTGMGAKGNDGVAAMVKKMPGAIGYCELAYSIQNKMPSASIQNKSGNFIKPAVPSISAAAAGAIPEDTRITLTNTDAPQGYPIASFTWLLLYKDMNYKGRTKEQAKAVVDMVKWMLTDGQKYAEPLDYAPLSEGAKTRALAQLKKVGYNGEALLK